MSRFGSFELTQVKESNIQIYNFKDVIASRGIARMIEASNKLKQNRSEYQDDTYEILCARNNYETQYFHWLEI